MDRADWDMFHHLSNDFPVIDPTIVDPDQHCDKLTSFLKSVADKSIPLSRPHPRKSPVPWWSEELSSLVRAKHMLGRRLGRLTQKYNNFRLVASSPSELRNLIDLGLHISVLKPLYNKFSAKFRKAVIQGRITSWRAFVATTSSSTNLHTYWRKFGNIKGKYISPPRYPLRHNGALVHDAFEISNIISRHFASISDFSSMDEYFLRSKHTHERVILNFDTQEDLIYNVPFTMTDFAAALLTCSSSAPGLDTITFDMLAHLALPAKQGILGFYNRLWTSGSFPKCWRHAVIIPILKPGKDPHHPANYRPISLTSCLCKLMEKMVNTRLSHFMASSNLLSPTQSGSLTGRSTLDPLSSFNLESTIRTGFKNKLITAAVFFDIQKAYDTSWRYPVLRSLHQAGCRGHLAVFLQNFLTDRTFQTRIQSTLSDTFSLVEGIPQGSVLSCSLFAIAINDIVKDLPVGVQNALYVDDFAIYFTTASLLTAQRRLQLAINKIFSWANSVGYRLSPEKTKSILFYRDKRWLGNGNSSLELNMGTSVIECCSSVRYLGMIFDSHLNWKDHIIATKAKCMKALNLMKCLARTTWGARRDVMIMVYKATVLSILDYGCPIYSSASDAVLRLLDPVHNLGARLCTGAFRSSPVNSLLVDSGLLPLSYRRAMLSMQNSIAIRSKSNITSRYFDQDDIFQGTLCTPPFPIRAERLLTQYGLHPTLPHPVGPPLPPWVLCRPRVCHYLSRLSKKQEHHPLFLCQLAMAHISSKGDSILIYTDGSKSSEGVGAAAVSGPLTVSCALPKHASIFTAELTAINLALTILARHPSRRAVILSDSRSALTALEQYNPKNILVKNLLLRAHALLTAGKFIQLCWIPAHVGIQGNESADAAAKLACATELLDQAVPYEDWRTHIKHLVFQTWQNDWLDTPITNKLRSIRDTVYRWPSSTQPSRRYEVLLTRLRLGHAKFTHGHLMQTPHTHPIECDSCLTPMTVAHLLVDCPVHANSRQKFNVPTLEGILAESPNFSMSKLVMFLNETGFLHNI